MTRRKAVLIGSTLLVTLLLALPAVAAEYKFGVSSQRTNITFQSETDFETILGASNEMSGVAHADFQEGTAHVMLSVPVESLRTGIDLRDDHLRSERWLHVEKYPTVRFALKRFEPMSKGQVQSKKKVRGTAHGELTIRGITRPIEIPGFA